MLSVLLILILVWAFYIGYRRGILLQGAYSLWALLSLALASLTYKQLVPFLTLWIPYSNPTEGVEVYFYKSVSIFDLDHVYYAGCAFVVVYVMVYLIGRLLGIFLHLISWERVETVVFDTISGVLSVLIAAISSSLVLSTLATVPLQTIQQLLNHSWLARLLVTHLSGIVHFIQQLWIG